jgi:hypothetical protein
VLFGAGASGVRAMILTDRARQEERNRRSALAQGIEYVPEPDDFYASTLDLVDLAIYVALVIAAGGLLVAVAEGIVARRRAYASLVAAGVPRGVLARSILWQALAPAVPGVALALATGAALTGGISGGTGDDGSAPSAPVPWGHLAAYGGLAIAAVLVTVGLGLLFLRASTAPEELRAT